MSATSPLCQPYHLICGIICGSISQITPLLQDINTLTAYDFLHNVSLYLLANGVTQQQLQDCTAENCPQIPPENTVILTDTTPEILPIGKARSLLQQSIGQAMLAHQQQDNIAWLMDDDMRIPASAQAYLPYLPLMKQRGIDAVIGCFDGGSPNPPAYGMRVQINDLYHNLSWLETLQADAILPDKSLENTKFRKTYPDYYYDLSRKHSAHLTLPYWLEKSHASETVTEARHDMLSNLDKIFTGEPFLRPLVTQISANPLQAMRASCNRGGNCFILNPHTLTLTPNAITQSNGMQNRRSDMIWALINRYYHGFNIMAVDFPLYHHRFANVKRDYNLPKHIAELKGAALYASLADFFTAPTSQRLQGNWHFTDTDCEAVIADYQKYIQTRLDAYQQNYQAINQLLQQLSNEFVQHYPQRYPTLAPFIQHAQKWVRAENLTAMQHACRLHNASDNTDLQQFLLALPAIINDYTKASNLQAIL